VKKKKKKNGNTQGVRNFQEGERDAHMLANERVVGHGKAQRFLSSFLFLLLGFKK
jgi:hypothetical protein